jgi:hypothetical protein
MDLPQPWDGVHQSVQHVRREVSDNERSNRLHPKGSQRHPLTNAGHGPLGQGFWKNHPDTWPVSLLTLGSQTSIQAELLALFDTPPRGDASVILAHQLIAAKLNIANGSKPAPIRSTIADADRLLSQFSGALPDNVRTSSAIGRQMVNDANVLDRYNNGGLTPGCQP